MVNVLFIYSKNGYIDSQKEKVAVNLINKASTLISLPEQIIIEFKKLQPNVYAETILQVKNKILLNETLSPTEIIKPIIHELIHINQIYTGLLSVTSDGYYIWNNRIMKKYNPKKMKISEYENLPWEKDVVNKQQFLIEQILTKI